MTDVSLVVYTMNYYARACETIFPSCLSIVKILKSLARRVFAPLKSRSLLSTFFFLSFFQTYIYKLEKHVSYDTLRFLLELIDRPASDKKDVTFRHDLKNSVSFLLLLNITRLYNIEWPERRKT